MMLKSTSVGQSLGVDWSRRKNIQLPQCTVKGVAISLTHLQEEGTSLVTFLFHGTLKPLVSIILTQHNTDGIVVI